MKKNLTAINTVWWICVYVNVISILWFVLGNTANFQRDIDLVTTVILMMYGIPSLILSSFSLFVLKMGGLKSYFGVLGAFCVIILLILLSVPLYKNVNISGWLIEDVDTDSKQITSDNKYEYCIELVNTFQRNSSIRLYLKNMQSNEEIRIRLNLPKVKSILWKPDNNYFTILQPTNQTGIYILQTQAGSPFPKSTFEINIEERKAIRLE